MKIKTGLFKVFLSILCMWGVAAVLYAGHVTRLDVFVGNVDVDLRGDGAYAPARTGMLLQEGSIIRTGEASYVRLLHGELELVLKQNMKISVAELARQSASAGRDSYFSFMSGLLKRDPAANVTVIAAVRHVGTGLPVAGSGAANARSLYERGDYQGAIAAFNENPPVNDGMKYILASSYFRVGDYNHASALFLQLFEGGYAAESMYHAALSLQAMNKYKEAAAVLDRYLVEAPESEHVPEALVLRGAVAESLERPAEASGFYRRLLREHGQGEAAEYARQRLRQLERPQSSFKNNTIGDFAG